MTEADSGELFAIKANRTKNQRARLVNDPTLFIQIYEARCRPFGNKYPATTSPKTASRHSRYVHRRVFVTTPRRRVCRCIHIFSVALSSKYYKNVRRRVVKTYLVNIK